VRIQSHGGSGTVIESTQGKSLILSCAHMFEDAGALQRPLKIDGVQQPGAAARKVTAKVLAVDFQADLILIELANGPFYSIPVAPQGYQPHTQLLSIGYDNMHWPVTCVPATLLSTSATTTYTRERPWHGRSGGGLLDPEHPYLVGVVQGYEVGGRGLYVSHARILRFLESQTKKQATPQPYYQPVFPRQPIGALTPNCPLPGR
jgi:hypothetical protein